jgi:hypothetical protein
MKTLNNIGDTLECNFTTSKIIEKVSSIAILMHTLEKYFDYTIGVSGCGIQNVHFLGEK